MSTPNHWRPSSLAQPSSYDLEKNGGIADDRLLPSNISRRSVGSIDQFNALYMTEAEDPASVTPFLKNNMIRDYERDGLVDRSYLVAPGGDTIYYRPTDTAHRQELPIPDMEMNVNGDSGGFKADIPKSRGRVRNMTRAEYPERNISFGHINKGGWKHG